MDRPIDADLSGTTAVTCYIEEGRIYTANAGDSRAILGSKGILENDWFAKELSRDHKPSLADEAERIFEEGGRVAPYFLDNGEPCGPDRVWLLDEDIPGLAMSRSIGDLVAASVGVTWEPGIHIHNLLRNNHPRTPTRRSFLANSIRWCLGIHHKRRRNRNHL